LVKFKIPTQPKDGWMGHPLVPSLIKSACLGHPPRRSE
jgi:hypothetical protein